MNWTVLCLSDAAASLRLYQSILEMDGHTVQVASRAQDALTICNGIAIDCIVIDCDDNAISITREIATARPGIPILSVSEQSEIQLQIYSETGMFATKEELIEQPLRCANELLNRTTKQFIQGCGRKSTCAADIESRALRQALVSWLLHW